MRPHFYIFLFTLFLCTSSRSQELIFRNLQQLDLPSFETYNVMQDSKGYIWISTDGGLCNYNGKSVKVFGKSKGIFEGSTYTVKEDKYGNIWCTTSQNRLLKVANDSVTEAPMSKMFESKLSKLHLNYYLNIEGDSIYTCSQLYSYCGTLNSSSLALRTAGDPISYYQLMECGNCLVPVRRTTTRATIDPVKSGTVCVSLISSKGSKTLMIPYRSNSGPNWRVCTAKNKSGSSFFSFDNYIVKINSDLSYSWVQTSGEVIALYVDNDDGLWAGNFKGGVYYFSNSNDITKHQRYMSDYSVSGICHDAEGGLWCTTLEKGVFYCRNKSITSYNAVIGLDKRSGFLKAVNNSIYTSCIPNVLFEVKAQNIKRYDLGSEGNYLLCDVLPIEKGWLISGRDFTMKTDLDFRSNGYVYYGDKRMVGTAQLTSGNGKIYGISFGDLFGINEKEKTAFMIKDPLESPGRAMVFAHNMLLVGLKDGLYKVSTETNNFDRVKGIQGEVMRVVGTNDGSIWICTKNDGLYRLENGIVENFSQNMKLPGTRYYDVAVDKLSTIWIASNIGLICMNNYNGKATVNTYNSSHGLPSTIIYDVEATEDELFVSTPEGLASFPLQAEISNYKSAPIYLASIKAHDVNVPLGSKLEFAYNNNSLKFDLDVLCFKGHTGPAMYYKLIGSDDKVHLVEGTQIKLDNIPSGKYKLEVYAYNNDGIAGKDPVVVEFRVLRPFWKEVWFYLLIILLLGIVVYLLTRRITKNFKAREMEKTRVHKLIAEHQLSALQAQMNPHFIFNAINSIQTYILENDTQIAYDYLAKFARLVRMVLHNAKEKTISLEREIELLTMYIELEQIRFENKFDLKFNVQEGLDTYQIQLPPMIIQPYVENAIWHGLMPMKGKYKGELKIEMFSKDKEVHIVVEDNGIGREASMKIKKTPGYKSVAMELTKERVDVLKSISGYESASIEIIDLYDDLGEAAGTRVNIIIPLN